MRERQKDADAQAMTNILVNLCEDTQLLLVSLCMRKKLGVLTHAHTLLWGEHSFPMRDCT